ncbi:MAG: hypothetical protein WBW41_09505 [Verrucomicrobiia bacterium]
MESVLAKVVFVFKRPEGRAPGIASQCAQQAPMLLFPAFFTAQRRLDSGAWRFIGDGF